MLNDGLKQEYFDLSQIYFKVTVINDQIDFYWFLFSWVFLNNG